MTKEELNEILNKKPSIKQGLDDFYGRQTVINAMTAAYNQAVRDCAETAIITAGECDYTPCGELCNGSCFIVDKSSILKNLIE